MADRLQEIEVFVAVADAGGLSRAAARMRLSAPAVTRALAALEDRLGVRLFNRTTRSLTLTEAGARFLESARRILADLEDARNVAMGASAVPQGHLSITASVTFGRAILAPIVCSFLERYPRVSVSLMLQDRITNLVDEGLDLAVRIGDLPDSSLIARRLGAVRRVLVASPGYLARHGAPATPADLKHHAIIAFTGLMPMREWRHHDGVRHVSTPLAPAFEINDALAALQAAKQGHGIAPALSYMVHEDIRDGSLVEVAPGGPQPDLAVQIVYPHSRLVAPKVRGLVDFAAPVIAAELERIALPVPHP